MKLSTFVRIPVVYTGSCSTITRTPSLPAFTWTQVLTSACWGVTDDNQGQLTKDSGFENGLFSPLGNGYYQPQKGTISGIILLFSWGMTFPTSLCWTVRAWKIWTCDMELNHNVVHSSHWNQGKDWWKGCEFRKSTITCWYPILPSLRVVNPMQDIPTSSFHPQTFFSQFVIHKEKALAN